MIFQQIYSIINMITIYITHNYYFHQFKLKRKHAYVYIDFIKFDIYKIQILMNNHRIVWTSQQDSILKQVIQIRKIHKWPQIAKILSEEFHFSKRTGKQCNERWKNVLDPTIVKKEWTKQQQQLLLAMYNKMGTRWCQIVKSFQGRSYNSIKNYFYSKIRRSIRKMNKIMKQLKLAKELRKIKHDQIFTIFRQVEDNWNSQFSMSKELQKQCNDIKKFILYEMDCKYDTNQEFIQKISSIVKKIYGCSKQIQSIKQIKHKEQIYRMNLLKDQAFNKTLNETSGQYKEQQKQINNIYQSIQDQSMEYMNISPLRQQSSHLEFMDNQ